MLECLVGNTRGGLSIYQTDLALNGSVDIEDLDAHDFQLYPNPVKDQLFCSSNKVENWEYVIVDALGRIVQKGSSFSSEKIIDLSMLQKGVYFIEIAYQSEKIAKKIMKL